MITVYIIANFCPKFEGSINGRFLYLAELLSKKGFKVELITSDFSHATKKYKETPKNDAYKSKLTYCHEPGYIKHTSLRRLYSHMIWGKNVLKYIKTLDKPDIIYCAMPSLTAPYLLSKYCSKNNIKFVVDVQDLWPEATFMLIKNRFIQKLSLPIKYLADKSYAAADLVIAVSDTYIDRVLSVNKKVKSGLAVYLGNDGAVFQSSRENFKINRTDKEFWVCYVGTHSYSYDLECVIKAISILKNKGFHNVRFVTLGDGPLKQKFENLADEMGILNTFYGRKPYEEMVGIMCSSDIVVNPIVKGSAASIINKVGDYALSGLPVVNTQECIEYRKLVESYSCGLNCEVGNYFQVADSIEYLINNYEKRIAMGQASYVLGCERFDRRFTYDRIARELSRLIRSEKIS